MDWTKLARPFPAFDGQITFFLLPYKSLRYDLAYEAVEKFIPRDQWQKTEITFVTFEGYMVDIRFALKPDAPPELLGLQAYWQSRTGHMDHDWQLFTTLFNGPVYLAFWEAYTATHETHLNAPAELTEEAASSDNPLSGVDGSGQIAISAPASRKQPKRSAAQNSAPKQAP